MVANRLILKNDAREKNLFYKRVIIFIIVIVILGFFLICRLFYLQIIQHKYYDNLSRLNHLAILPVEPSRGLIFDRNGVLLAENKNSYSLDIIVDQTKDLEKTVEKLRKVIPIDDQEIENFYQMIDRQRRFLPVSIKLNLTEAEVARFYVNQYLFPGVIINAHLQRSYPLGEALVSVLGYVGRINSRELANLDTTNYSASNFIGKTGIEKYYEEELHGTVGYTQVEIDVTGHVLRTVKRVPPVSGSNLYLTIDSALQRVAISALGNESGAIVAIEPSTGEVLALVSKPSFDPNLFSKGITKVELQKLQSQHNRPLYNRAIRGQFPIASTIKPYLALQGLDTGVININYRINDPGWFKLPNASHVYLDWNWKFGGHGYVNVVKAIIVSSDTFFYNLAVMLGISRVDDILQRFGFGSKTGLDVPNEEAGLLPNPEWKKRVHGSSWYTGDTVNAGIGQGFMLTTPIQLANAVAILANRGIQVRLHLLKKLETPDFGIEDVPISKEEAVVLKNSNNWSVVINAMQGVINSTHPAGTGRNSFGTDAQYSIAAKTGTAQVYSKHGRYEHENNDVNVAKKLRNHSLFIAFAPVDKPKIAIAVVAEHSMIAGNIARKVLDFYLTTKNKKEINART